MKFPTSVNRLSREGREILDCSRPGNVDRAVQSEKDNADLNVIVSRHLRMNVPLPPIPQQIFGDATEIPSYQEALDRVIAVGEFFQKLPSKVRNVFDNDPQRMLTMEGLSDEDRKVLVESGFLEARKAAEEAAKPAEPAPTQ